MTVIPRPKKMIEKAGYTDCTEFEFFGDREVLNIFPYKSTPNATAFNFIKDTNLACEEYKIDTDGAVTVRYSTLEGAYRALATFEQIRAQSTDGKIANMTVHDRPKIKRRAFMLDISRGRLPKTSTLKKLIDLMAMLKYNELQLYVDAPVYAYPNFCGYTNKASLTPDDIKEIQDCCKKHFIRLVPNQNSFGHMGAWLKKDAFSHLAIHGGDGKPTNTLNPLNDGCCEFLRKLYGGYADIFDADTMHIGMDEPFDLGTGETEEICKEKGVGTVYTDYLNKVCRIAKDEYGKVPMFWSDIVFKHEENLKDIPRYAVVMEWGYENEHRFDKNAQKLHSLGLDFYLCPGTSCHNSFTGRSDNMIFNISAAVKAAQSFGARGVMLTEWGDFGHPQFPVFTAFPLAFAAALSWSGLSGDEDTAYDERREVIENCKSFLDRFIFSSKVEFSFADALLKAGNYYLLENSLHTNKTLLYGRTVKKDFALTASERSSFESVYEYIKKVKSELILSDADTKCTEQALVNIDMVVLFCEYLLKGASPKLGAAFKDLKERFVTLWCGDNFNDGHEIFCAMIDDYINFNRE